MSRRVVITGMGCISGLGRNLADSWSRLASGEGAIAPAEGEAGAEPVAAIAPHWLDRGLGGRDLRSLGKLDPLSAYALAAAIEAVEQARLFGHPVLSERTAILLG